MNWACVLCATAVSISAAAVPDDFYTAVRNGDLAKVKSIAAAAGANLRDSRGTTPLMYAAAFGNAATVKVLLDAGADPNAANDFGVTALMWAVNDLDKVTLLLAKGANVNARSKMGRTALLTAASDDRGLPVVRMLVEHGAQCDRAVDPPTGSRTGPPTRRADLTPLMAASFSHSVEMIRFLLDKGVDVNAADEYGNTALMYAASEDNVPAIRLLLAKGADVNAVSKPQTGPGVKNGPVAIGSYTPLMTAAAFGSPEAVKALLDAGANVNAQDVRGMTPLMLAIGADHNNAGVVRLLLDRGADPKIKSKDGEDAYDWARKFLIPEVMNALRLQAPGRRQTALAATPRVEVTRAIQKSMALLQRSTAKFLSEGGCVACHAQNITSMAAAAARASGIPVDENAAAEALKATRFGWARFEQPMLQRADPPGAPDATVYGIMDLAAARFPAGRITDAMVFNIAALQRASGEWSLGFIARPPIEDGNFTRTALAIRALQLYGMPARKVEFDRRIARARAWLIHAQPVTAEDRNMRLLGLKWAGAGAATIRRLSQDVLAGQRADGGWSQTPYLDSDAYATAQSMYALWTAGMSPQRPAYRRGVAFLLNTQLDDGSWHVRSRAPRFQPYFDSGFPHGHDQWISSMATGWAVVALAPAVPRPPAVAMR